MWEGANQDTSEPTVDWIHSFFPSDTRSSIFCFYLVSDLCHVQLIQQFSQLIQAQLLAMNSCLVMLSSLVICGVVVCVSVFVNEYIYIYDCYWINHMKKFSMTAQLTDTEQTEVFTHCTGVYQSSTDSAVGHLHCSQTELQANSHQPSSSIKKWSYEPLCIKSALTAPWTTRVFFRL